MDIVFDGYEDGYEHTYLAAEVVYLKGLLEGFKDANTVNQDCLAACCLSIMRSSSVCLLLSDVRPCLGERIKPVLSWE